MLVCTMFALPLPSSSATAPVARVLTDLEAAERLKQHGPNRLKPPLQRAVVMSVTLDFVQSAAVPPTAFEVGTRQVGLLIMRLTLLLVLFTLLVNVALQRSLLASVLFAVALAVGLTPELLPMVVLVTLTRGALRMARFKVIVKRPSVIRNPLRSHPNRWLVLTSLPVVLLAMALPFTGLAPYLGFSPLPLKFFGVLSGLLVCYLLAVEGGEQWFYKRLMKA